MEGSRGQGVIRGRGRMRGRARGGRGRGWEFKVVFFSVNSLILSL